MSMIMLMLSRQSIIEHITFLLEFLWVYHSNSSMGRILYRKSGIFLHALLIMCALLIRANIQLWQAAIQVTQEMTSKAQNDRFRRS